MGSIGASDTETFEGPTVVCSSSNPFASKVFSRSISPENISTLVSEPLKSSSYMANTVTQPAQQRTLIEMLRHMPSIGPKSSSSSFMNNRPYGSSTNVSLSGGFGDSVAPALDSTSEFPVLNARSSESSQPSSSSTNMSMVGRSYGTLFGQSLSSTVGGSSNASKEVQHDFIISNEDFPALPGVGSIQPTKKKSKSITGSIASSTPLSLSSTSTSSSSASSEASSELNEKRREEKAAAQKRGIQTTSEGKVSNIPSSMVTDQFGMVGLLMFIRAAETDSNLVSLAQGSDLTTLGLNLNSPENLYPNFGGPWAEAPCRPQDIDYHVPQEYLTNQQIGGKLAPIKFDRYGEDLLFYMFYSNPGDKLQIMAAGELYNRDWRYHKEERVWITRAPGKAPVEKSNTYERGTYFYFDAQNWRKVPKEFHLEYDKLEDRPTQISTASMPASSGRL